jgi:hypothetical protein
VRCWRPRKDSPSRSGETDQGYDPRELSVVASRCQHKLMVDSTVIAQKASRVAPRFPAMSSRPHPGSSSARPVRRCASGGVSWRPGINDAGHATRSTRFGARDAVLTATPTGGGAMHDDAGRPGRGPASGGRSGRRGPARHRRSRRGCARGSTSGLVSEAPEPQLLARVRSRRGSRRSQWRCRAEGLKASVSDMVKPWTVPG